MKYLTCAETAKIVRAALKKRWPGVKFSVRSHVYAGGASIDVGWTDGPLWADVDQFLNQFEGGRFDGSIDMKTSVTHYLHPDGTASVRLDLGTERSGGVFPAVDNRAQPVGEEVHFGADFVFAQREVSEFAAKREQAAAWVNQHVHVEDGMVGGRHLSEMLDHMVRLWTDGPDWEERAFGSIWGTVRVAA